MKSRIVLLSALAASALSLAGCGGNGKTKIGILQFGSFEALEKAKQGFVDAINASSIKDKVEIQVKNAAANGADNVSMAATLAGDNDLLYGIATPSASQLKNAVDSLGTKAPVLFSAVTDAVGANLLKNEKAPEGNCTGVLDIGPIARELEVLTQFPGVDNIVSFYNSGETNSIHQVEIAEAWMKEHDVSFSRKAITNASEINSALSSISNDVDAIFLPTDDTIANSIAIVKAANEARSERLFIVGSDTGMIEGCTFALGVDYYECGVQAGKMAISILGEGKAIKDIPVQTCDKNSIFINKTWAESLGQTIPEEVLSIEGAIIK